MKFKLYGKSCQLVVEKPEDLPDILSLDESLWAVTSAPVSAFKCDAAFLNYLDSDHNDRIRTDELKNAVAWYLQTLSDYTGSGTAADTEQIIVANIKPDGPDADALRMTAAYISEQTKAAPDIVTLAQVRACMNELKMRTLNGDGVIVPAAAETPEVAAYIQAAVSATGGGADLSGSTGISEAQLDAFRDAIPAYLDWLDRGNPADNANFPLGAESDATWKLLEKYRAQIDAFFILAHFQGFDPANAQKFITAAADAPDATAALDAAPIAKPDANGSLPFTGATINPLYRDALLDLRDNLFAKVLGTAPDSATEDDWRRVKAVMAPYGDYLASKKGAIADAFPVDQLKAWAASDIPEKVKALIEKDKEVATRVSGLNALEKLILYHRHLIRFANNFVSLSEFYEPEIPALFERGSAVIDGRWFKLAIRADDPAKHSAVAKNSGLFTFYLRVEPRDGAADAQNVVVPATAGTAGNLAVGKRGIFFDLDGKEYDAVITTIIENPISLKEAMLAPFSKIGKMIMGKIEGLSANAENTLLTGADKFATAATEGKPLAPAAAPPPAAPASSPANVFMSASVSVAALGSGFAFFAKSFGGMSGAGRLYSALAALGIILFPIMLVGIIKLAKQDMSYIFEGCGWAVNQRMRLTRRLRRQFTVRKNYPKAADGTPEKRFRATLTTILLAVILLALASIIAGRLFTKPSPVAESGAPIEAATNAVPTRA